MVEGRVVEKFLKSENKGYLNWCGVTFASQRKSDPYWNFLAEIAVNKFFILVNEYYYSIHLGNTLKIDTLSSRIVRAV